MISTQRGGDALVVGKLLVGGTGTLRGICARHQSVVHGTPCGLCTREPTYAHSIHSNIHTHAHIHTPAHKHTHARTHTRTHARTTGTPYGICTHIKHSHIHTHAQRIRSVLVRSSTRNWKTLCKPPRDFDV